jgi:transcriptional regulator with XRE-family HTH domain
VAHGSITHLQVHASCPADVRESRFGVARARSRCLALGGVPFWHMPLAIVVPPLCELGVAANTRRGTRALATSPTVRQRELGARLRALRNERGMTVEEVADKLLCSATKISRLETGARRPSLRDVRDLCGLYDVDEAVSVEFMALAREAREQGWWTQYNDLKLDPYIGLEQDAIAITSYTMFYIPALLQTEDYARAIIKAVAPKILPDIHQQRVEVRLRRQQRLQQENRPRYRVLVDEAVLYHRVGGPAIMAAQLDRVLEAARDGLVTVQIVPFDAAHASQDSNFVLLEFEEDSNLNPVVFIESLITNQYLERRDEILRYREAIEYLRDSALSPRDSLNRISAMQRACVSEIEESPA